MKMKLCLVALSTLILSTGCSMQNKKWGPGDWERVAPSISGATEFAARTALQSDQVKPHGVEICTAMNAVSTVLGEFDDADATFDAIRVAALKAVRDNLPSGTVRDTASLVVDQILSITFLYARDKYDNLLQQDQARTVLIISRAAATGITNACRDLSLSSFEFAPMPDVSR